MWPWRQGSTKKKIASLFSLHGQNFHHVTLSEKSSVQLEKTFKSFWKRSIQFGCQSTFNVGRSLCHYTWRQVPYTKTAYCLLFHLIILGSRRVYFRGNDTDVNRSIPARLERLINAATMPCLPLLHWRRRTTPLPGHFSVRPLALVLSVHSFQVGRKTFSGLHRRRNRQLSPPLFSPAGRPLIV